MYMYVKFIYNIVIIYKYLSYNMILVNKIKKKIIVIYLLNVQKVLLQINRQGGQKKKLIIKKNLIWGRIFKN